jgi:hypothetical protein
MLRLWPKEQSRPGVAAAAKVMDGSFKLAPVQERC